MTFCFVGFDLSEGYHVLTVSATDSYGNVGSGSDSWFVGEWVVLCIATAASS